LTLCAGYILQKVPAGKWLGFNVIAWGIATACTAAATDYNTLLAARVVLGIFEAAIAPCLMLIGSQYYTRSEQAPRFSFWYCGLGVAQILGGIISYAFQWISPGASLAGWRIMFVVLGVVTVLIGATAALVLPDTPMTATWLSEEEKVALLSHVSENRTGVENHTTKWSQVTELLLDPQMWLLTLITILVSILFS
jgi:MFS family permease